MPARWTSRKFLMSLGAQIAAVTVLLWPQHESAILTATQSIMALIVILLTSLGYIKAEASIDRETAGAAKP